MEQMYPGEELGLPETGPGSVAGLGRRVGAVLIDAVLAGAITWPFTAPNLPENWSLIGFVAMYVLTSWFFGRTPGMMILKLRLAVEGEGNSLSLVKAILRTALLMLLIPAVLQDGSRRGLHDKAAGTVVVSDI